MKTIVKKIALSTMALLGLMACEDENVSYSNDSNAVHITAQIGNVTGNFTTKSNPIGTDDDLTAFNRGDRISVAAGTQSEVVYTLGQENSWTPETSYLYWETTPMTFHAYYPAGKNSASMTSFTMPTSYNSVDDLADADYMTFSGEIEQSSSVALPMERKMARVIIENITYRGQYASGYELNEVKYTTNTRGYEDGQLLADDNASAVAFLHTDGHYYALLAPTLEAADKSFIVLTLKHTADKTTKELTVKGIPVLKAGNSYAYNLTIGNERVTFSNVTVKPWDSGVLPSAEASIIERPYVDATTHTVYLSKEGQLTDEMIAEAIGTSGTVLNIDGPMNDADFALLMTECSSVKDFDLSNVEAEAIPDYTFNNMYGSNSFTSIKLPAKLKKIGDGVFYACTGMTSISLPESLTTIGASAFHTCNSLTEITLPDKVISIGDHTFFYCQKLKNITLPEGITSISAYLFGYCSMLSEVTCLGNITSIGAYAFDNCTALQSIDLTACTAAPTFDSEAFHGITQDVIIKVKASLVEAFEAAKNNPRLKIEGVEETE